MPTPADHDPTDHDAAGRGCDAARPVPLEPERTSGDGRGSGVQEGAGGDARPARATRGGDASRTAAGCDGADLRPLEVMRRELVLDAVPGDVWAELADDDGLAGWLADEVDLDVREGATGTVRDAGGAPRSVEVDEVVPGRRLGLVWRDEDDRPTLVDIALESFGVAGTRVVVVEVPLETVRLVAPAADRILAVGRPGGTAANGGAQGSTATAAGRVLAGVR